MYLHFILDTMVAQWIKTCAFHAGDRRLLGRFPTVMGIHNNDADRITMAQFGWFPIGIEGQMIVALM